MAIVLCVTIVASCALIGAIDLVVKAWEAVDRRRTRRMRRHRYES